MDGDLWTPGRIRETSRAKDLNTWHWRPLGLAWALTQERDLRDTYTGRSRGHAIAAITGYTDGQPWAESDELAPIDGNRVWLRGLVDGRLVLPPSEYHARDLWVLACGLQWTEARLRM